MRMFTSITFQRPVSSVMRNSLNVLQANNHIENWVLIFLLLDFLHRGIICQRKKIFPFRLVDTGHIMKCSFAHYFIIQTIQCVEHCSIIKVSHGFTH